MLKRSISAERYYAEWCDEAARSVTSVESRPAEAAETLMTSLELCARWKYDIVDTDAKAPQKLEST